MVYDLLVIGGGPAGLAAACAAWESGLKHILLVERDRELGGILNQCIHNGFGLHHFHEELTGPEYAGRFIEQLSKTGVEVRTDTMVLALTPEREVHMMGAKTGYRVERAKSVILAMGCRERTRGAIGIPGTRPAGIFTAGAAQRYVNMEGFLPGRRVVILGSGDIGLIMARRMTLEGAKVLACVEVMPHPGGLNRNIVQCLNDYEIPLYLSHTVTDIRGRDRVEQVVVSKVDEHRNPIPGTEMVFDCDTLLLSVGLIPENELTRMAGIEMDRRTNGAVVYENLETSIPGVFTCGTVAHVHDLVDYVTAESEEAGRAAARYVLEGGAKGGPVLEVKTGENVSYTVPQHIRPQNVENRCNVFFRVREAGQESEILVESEGTPIARFARDHVAPGEMECIALPKVLLDKAAGSLTVSVRAKGGTAQ